MDSQLSYHFNLLFSTVINFLISINNLYFQHHSQLTSPPNLIDIDIEQPPNYSSNYESINDFLEKNRNINKYEFFLKANDIDRVNMRHQYVHGLNGGSCWNCYNFYSHECCAACKKISSQCRCVYICGYTFPSGQQNKNGAYSQFKKCKYYTSDINNIEHHCLGVVKNDEHVTLFINEQDVQNFSIKCF